MKNKVGVIIVTWNARKYLKKCILSVQRETSDELFEIFVVDNASTDGTPEMLKKDFPDVQFIQNRHNLGFAAANNIAFQVVFQSQGLGYILLLNADVVIQDRAIERLMSYLENHSEVGAVAPALILPDSRFQTGAAGYLPTVLTGLNYFLFLSRIFPKICRGFFIDQSYFSKKNKSLEVGWLAGACLMLRRDVVEKVGPMDEEFNIYVNDIEWGARMKKKGIQLHYLPWVSVQHVHGMTYKAILKKINTEWLVALYTFIYKNRGRTTYILFRFLSAAGFFLRFAGYAFLFVLKRTDDKKIKTKEMFWFMRTAIEGKEIIRHL